MKIRLLISIIAIGVISLSGFLVYALIIQYQNLEHHKSQIAPRDELLLNLKDNSISDTQKRELVTKYNDLVNTKKFYLDYDILGLKNNYNLEDDISFSILEFGRYNSCWNLNVMIAETQTEVVIYDDTITQFCLEPKNGINVNYKIYKIETTCRINGTFDVHVSNIPAFEDTKIGEFTCGDGVIGSVALSLNDEITYIPKNILGLKTDNVVTSADAATTCDQSLTTVKNKAPFPVLTPTIMLEGYTLQGAEYIEPSRVQLKYSDGNVCGEQAKTLRDGVIEIIAGPLDTAFDVKDGKELANLFANNSPAKDSITSFVSNGKQIIGIPAWVGKSVVIDDNNKIINEEPYDTPTTVFVVDDSSGMLYRLNGFIPMDDLLQIAKSLK